MKKSNVVKIVAAVAVLLAVVGILVWAPMFGGEPDPGPEVRVPAMQNVPPPDGTYLRVEVPPENTAADK